MDPQWAGLNGIRIRRRPVWVIFARTSEVAQHAPAVQTYGLSLWFGTTLIVAGVAVNLLSGWHHFRLIRSMDQGQVLRPHATSLALGTALFLALIGLGMAIYLLSIRDSVRFSFWKWRE